MKGKPGSDPVKDMGRGAWAKLEAKTNSLGRRVFRPGRKLKKKPGRAMRGPARF